MTIKAALLAQLSAITDATYKAWDDAQRFPSAFPAFTFQQMEGTRENAKRRICQQSPRFLEYALATR